MFFFYIYGHVNAIPLPLFFGGKNNPCVETRKEEVMDASGYFIPKNKKNSKSQDIWLALDTPIMCVKNNKELNLKNGKTYKLSSIQKDAIKVRLAALLQVTVSRT